MTRLEYLSQFSNAVLSPELNTFKGSWGDRSNHSGRAKRFEAQGFVSKVEKDFRKRWCKKQDLGEFGAVLGEEA